MRIFQMYKSKGNCFPKRPVWYFNPYLRHRCMSVSCSNYNSSRKKESKYWLKKMCHQIGFSPPVTKQFPLYGEHRREETYLSSPKDRKSQERRKKSRANFVDLVPCKAPCSLLHFPWKTSEVSIQKVSHNLGNADKGAA